MTASVLKFGVMIITTFAFAFVLRVSAETAPASEVQPIIVQAIAFSAQGGGKVTVHNERVPPSPTYVHEWCSTGHWLEWTIDGAAAGDYELLLRYGEKFEASRQVWINGVPVKGLESMKLSSTGDWPKMRDSQAPAPVPLTAGRNTLRITCLDNASIWLSQIRLTRSGTTITIDPASFTGQGGGRAQAIISNTRGFFSMWDDKGHALEWTIPHTAAGEYTLSLGCATSEVPTRELRVNGEVAKGFEAFTVPCTWGWRNWCNEELPGKVRLREGQNVLRLTNVTKAINLTYLCLSRPGSPDIMINAIDFSGQTGGRVQVHPPSRKYISDWRRVGQWLEWRFDAPAAGRYDLTLRYNPPPDLGKTEPADVHASSRKFELNGVALRGMEAYIAPGFSPRDWVEVQAPVPFMLKAGANVLRITNLEEGDLELYELRFTPAQKQ